MEERCFVTGAAGFIGSHLVEGLLREGCTVTGFDNLRWGRRASIQHCLDDPRFTFVQGDLLDPQALAEAMRGHSLVFHLGASADVRSGTDDTRLDLENCTVATYNVLEAMRANGVKKIVFTSSGTIYGELGSQPIPESAGPNLPISLYGAAKLACEALVSAYCHLFDIHAWIFRCGQIVGARMGRGVIRDLLDKLQRDPTELEVLGDGKQVKSYLLIEEWLEGVLYAYRNANHSQCQVFNMASESPLRVAEVARIIVQETGRKDVRIRYTGGERGWPGDVPEIRFDMSKLRRLGWEPKHSSAEAVRIATRRLLGEKK
ncbi:MAG: NAD-dependent epimerase/dehydratase family protein [Chloroflexi bacterium]|nr:NAD-dependent epimerase/dehydratase family protein [Chloroflexota bacterium]